MKKNPLFYVVFAGVLILVILGIWFFTRNTDDSNGTTVSSFEECVAAGYSVMESYPRQCRTPDGRLFTEEIDVPTTTPNGDIPDGDGAVQAPISISKPSSGSTISSPLSVSGEARGTWYFEGSFPVRVVDANGTELGVAPVQAEGEWMTEAFVPFSGTITFSTPTTKNGFVVFEKDNPSGLPSQGAEVRVPVTFAVVSEEKKPINVQVYFYNSTLLNDQQDECTTVFAVTRTIPYTQAVARAALEELLKDATPEERSQGYGSAINTGVKIQKLTIENGTAYVDFNERIQEQVGGSCKVSLIRRQITETLNQFPTVDEVVISVNGNVEEALQP